jgi:hypothetical protein
MSVIVIKIMTEVLAVFAVATKQIRRGRLSTWHIVCRPSAAERITVKFANKLLLGENDVEAILKRLDRLTKEEALATVANTLEIVHELLSNVKEVMDGAQAISLGLSID